MLQALSTQSFASLLIKIVAVTGLPKSRDGALPAAVEVGVQDSLGTVVRKMAPINQVVANNSKLPLDQILELKVADKQAVVVIKALAKGGDAEHRLLTIGSAQFPVCDIFETRTLTCDVVLDKGGVISLVASARGLYSMDEWELLEWLDDAATDLPMLLKCGIRNCHDLEAHTHSELLALMEGNGLSDPVRARIASKCQAARLGYGFLSPRGRRLCTRILRFHHYPSQFACSLQLGGDLRVDLTPKWRGSLLEECILHGSPDQTLDLSLLADQADPTDRLPPDRAPVTS